MLTLAVGAHALAPSVQHDPKRLESWRTAARFQMAHAVALIAASSVKGWSRGTSIGCALMAAGTLMFSGSIYALVLDRDRFRVLGPVTPLGGLVVTAGWIALMF